MWWSVPVIPASEEAKKEHPSVSLCCTASSRPAWATRWDPISKNQNQEDRWYREHYTVKHAGVNRIHSISINYLKFFKKAKREKQKLGVVGPQKTVFKVGSLFCDALWQQTHHTLVETHKLQQSESYFACRSQKLTGCWYNSSVITHAITEVNGASCRHVFSP